MRRYRNPAIKQLRDHQIKYAPRELRLKQIDRAEFLLNELQPNTPLSYQELCEKVTSYRGEMYPDLVLTGEEARHDLRCFVEDLSDSVNISADNAGEQVWTLEDLGKLFNVSTKTVSRWRDRGLVSRRFRFNGRKRVGFLKSSVERFVQSHSNEVDHGSNFSQLSLDDRERLIHRARKLVQAGGCQTEVNHRLARSFGRSPETIRYTLKRYDKAHPEVAVFPHSSIPLTDEQKREMYRRFGRGVSIESLSIDFDRTRTSIYRLIAEVRAQFMLNEPINFMDAADFHESNADVLILSAPPQTESQHLPVKTPLGLPPYLESLYAIPLLSREEEVYYFRKMNYLKCRAAELQKGLDLVRPKTRTMDEIERLLKQAGDVKNFLIRSNLRLVVSIAKKHSKPNISFFEMVSDGNMALMRAIEKFDYTRGFKFSTYASWAIMKNYARSIPAEFTQLDRFQTGTDEVFSQSSNQRSDGLTEELINHRQHETLMTIILQLPAREREIIVSRFGLSHGSRPKTLEQVGVKLGVTKERIRQLEVRALEKLRKIAEGARLDIPGI
jgi:RNA polymerase sigma factor (sigma-70 family)